MSKHTIPPVLRINRPVVVLVVEVQFLGGHGKLNSAVSLLRVVVVVVLIYLPFNIINAAAAAEVLDCRLRPRLLLVCAKEVLFYLWQSAAE